jgi:hypothetical protein
MRLPIIYLQADLPEGTKEHVACAAQERLSRGERLPVELIIGAILRPREEPGDPITPDNFAANTAFLKFLHRIIEKNGPKTEHLIAGAESVGEGSLYVIDGRAPKPEPGKEWVISSEDVLGEFQVEDGEIVPDSYRRNPDHRLFSSEGRGFFQLEDELAKCLIAELERIPEPEGDYIAGGWEMIH